MVGDFILCPVILFKAQIHKTSACTQVDYSHTKKGYAKCIC